MVHFMLYESHLNLKKKKYPNRCREAVTWLTVLHTGIGTRNGHRDEGDTSRKAK